MLFSDRLMVEISNWRLSRSLCDPLGFYFIFSFRSFLPVPRVLLFYVFLIFSVTSCIIWVITFVLPFYPFFMTPCVCKYDLACSCHSSVCPSVVCPATPSPFPLFCFTGLCASLLFFLSAVRGMFFCLFNLLQCIWVFSPVNYSQRYAHFIHDL